MGIDPSNIVPGQQSQGDSTTNPPANVATPPSHGEQGNPSIEELQRKLAELERDNRKYRTERKQQEEAAQLALQKQLEEQGQFKALAEQHEARVKQLEPFEQQYNTLAIQLSAQIEAQVKDWPPEIKAFDPGKDAPIEQRLAWIDKSKPIIDRLQQTARASLPGNGENPKPAGELTAEQREKQETERLRRSGRYGSIK